MEMRSPFFRTPDLRIWKLKDVLSQPLACGRSKSWTVHLYVRANGQLLSPLVILPGLSVNVNIINLFNKTNGVITATETAYQTEDTFYEDLKQILPLIGATESAPGILDLDGHITPLQSRVEALCQKYHINCIISPSHGSILYQALNNEINASLQALYNTKYYAIQS